MPRWYDKAEEQLDQELENGDISNKEFNEQMRDLNNELRDNAREIAENAYNEALY